MAIAVIELRREAGTVLLQAVLPAEADANWVYEYDAGEAPAGKLRVALTWIQPPPSETACRRAMDYLAAIRDHCREIAESSDETDGGLHGLAREILALMDESAGEESAEYDEGLGDGWVP